MHLQELQRLSRKDDVEFKGIILVLRSYGCITLVLHVEVMNAIGIIINARLPSYCSELNGNRMNNMFHVYALDC